MPQSRRAVAYRSSPPRLLDLSALSERALLGTRLCDLGLRLQGSELAAGAEQLYRELDRKGIAFRPHMWLSTEWFSPDDVPGFAIPFYLAHPRLRALERRMMGEVEGGTPRSFQQLMRHEAGHAIDSAYRLHDREEWQQLFGPFDAPYRRHYQAKPYSKRFVRHLPNWYAQSHPAEDFAETFAVWLDPGSRWRSRYGDWHALEKLLYVQRTMREVAGRDRPVRSHEQVEPIAALSQRLGEYYEEKRRRYRLNLRHVYERDLKRLFHVRTRRTNGVEAAEYMLRARPEIRKLVANRTGAYQYAIDRVLAAMIERSADLDLVVAGGLVRGKHRADDRQRRRVAAQLERYLAQGHHRLAR